MMDRLLPDQGRQVRLPWCCPAPVGAPRTGPDRWQMVPAGQVVVIRGGKTGLGPGQNGDDLGKTGTDPRDADATSVDQSHPIVDPRSGTTAARLLALAGLVSVVFCALSVGIMAVLPGSRTLNPLAQTISEYALTEWGWVFNLGVSTLAVGSAGVLAALILRGLVRPTTPAALLMAAWSVGLVGLVIFPKHVFGVDATFGGRVHWTWTMIAFVSLPVAALLLTRKHRSISCDNRWPIWARLGSVVAVGWFAVLAVQTAMSILDLPGWQIVGLVERGLSLTEMAVVAGLGMWAMRGCGCRVVGADNQPSATTGRLARTPEADVLP